jgi:hypothetical protein
MRGDKLQAKWKAICGLSRRNGDGRNADNINRYCKNIRQYMASGSCAFSPIANAGIGEVGMARTSTSLKTLCKFCAEHIAHEIGLIVIRIIVTR